MFWCAVFLLLWFLYLFNRATCGRAKSPTSLVGKTAIVTGGNAGIGYQVALSLAARGCKVIIADRDDSERSRLKIIEHTQNPNVLSKHLDLASFKSVRKFAEEINSTEPHLELLINNAGVGVSSDVPTEDGIEATMQINYFGPFLLTHLLVDLLKKSAPSRIIFTNSIGSFFKKLPLIQHLKKPNYPYGLLGKVFIYSNSKLALLMAADIFAEKLRGAGVTSNSVHPGWVRTAIIPAVFDGRPACYPIKWFMAVFGYVVGKSASEGAQTIIHLALSRSQQNVTGEFFGDCRKIPKPRQAADRELTQKIWKFSEEVVHLSPGEKM